LHSLLEDERHARVVSWGSQGNSFIIKDQSEFAKSILPKHFKHSNFASFVRQLNKYDFHKVKRNNEQDIKLYGEHAWEFDHPMFRRHRYDLLEGIKRKCTKSQLADMAAQMERLQQRLDTIERLQDETAESLGRATQQCETLTGELQEAHQGLAARDRLMNQISPKVLLVEDDVVCRQLSGKILQVFGCTLDEAEDGVAAVNKMNISKYDLVFMDIMMPHLDGMSATAQIRQFDRCTPIVSLTANFTQDARIVYMSCGMNDVLPKPFSRDTLLSVVEKYC
ncbi:CheY-like superfamily, partial [Syncephalis pseudoplumigaleata]